MTEEDRLKAIEHCDKILELVKVQQDALANIARIFDNLAHNRPATEGLPKRGDQ